MRHLLAPIIVVCSVFVTTFLYFLYPSHTTESFLPKEEREERSGALAALEFWTQARAYPDKDIPPGKFYKAYAFSKSKIKKLPPSIQSAGSWESIGPRNLSGRCLSVAVNPQNSNTIYVGSASGGLWRSYTAGLGGDWQRVATGYPVLGVASIAISPVDSNIMYIGTGEVYRYQGAYGGLIVRTTRGSYGIGILKTTNGGTSWTKTLDWSSYQTTGVQAIRINPLNPNTVWAATTEGFVLTTDAGANWDMQIPALQGMDILINPVDTTSLLISYGNFGNNSGVSVTTDNGMNWTQCSLPPFTGKTLLGLAPSDPFIVYASVADSTTGVASLWQSTDFGLNWIQKHDFTSSGIYGVQGWYSHYVAVHPTDPQRIVVASVSAQKSTDGGSTFSNVSGLYSDNHGYASDMNNPNILYSVDDDGIYRSTNFGSSFTRVGNGLVTGQFYNGLSCSSTDPSLSIVQSQDHIPGYKYTGSLNWTRSAVDEAGWTGINPENDSIMYAVYRYGEAVYRSTNRGVSFSLSVSLPGTAAWNTPLIISPSNPDVLYVAKDAVYKSINGGATWSTTSTGIVSDGNFALALGISFTNSDTVYVGKGPFASGPHLYRTTNGGSTWQDITGITPNRYPLDIAVDPNNSRVVYACFGGFGTGHVFKSTNAGINWTDISGSLPDAPVTALIVDPQNSNYIYAGTDVGVFVSIDAGTSWNSFSEGFTDAVLVSDLTISPSNRKLRAATHGNGAFERDMPGTLPFLQITSPNGGEVWDVASSHSISWSEGLAGLIHIEYSSNNGTSWNTIATSVNSMAGSFPWTIPSAVSNHALIRVSSEAHPGLTDESDATFSIRFSGTNLAYTAGWNMVSLSLHVSDSSRGALFPESDSPAYEFIGGYIPRETLAVGHGYWLRFASDSNFPLYGDSVFLDSIPVVDGWNLIGSISSPIAVTNILSDPPGLVTSSFFKYAVGYHPCDSLLPGFGYWVKVNGGGTLMLSASTSFASVIHIVPTNELPPAGPSDADVHHASTLPKTFALEQNYPNPFNPTTNIEFRIAEPGFVSLQIFDIEGKTIATIVDQQLAAGTYRKSWNASNLPSGIYYAAIQAGTFSQTRKMLLIK